MRRGMIIVGGDDDEEAGFGGGGNTSEGDDAAGGSLKNRHHHSQTSSSSQQQQQQQQPVMMQQPLPQREPQLTYDDKRFLLSVERGDIANVLRMLDGTKMEDLEDGNGTQEVPLKQPININCTDPLGEFLYTGNISGWIILTKFSWYGLFYPTFTIIKNL